MDKVDSYIFGQLPVHFVHLVHWVHFDRQMWQPIDHIRFYLSNNTKNQINQYDFCVLFLTKQINRVIFISGNQFFIN